MNNTTPFIIDGHQDIAFNTIHCTGKDFFRVNRLDESQLLPEPQLNQSDYVRLVQSGVKVVQGVIFPYRFTETGGIESSEDIGAAETERQLDFYNTLAEKSEGKIRILKSKKDLDTVMATEGMLGVLVLMEDAIGIRRDLSNLEGFYSKGLRVVGPVWNRDNQFAGGTDTTMGFTEEGKNLLKKMEELGIALDTAHMNPTDLSDALPLFNGVVLNSHTCAHALNPHRRNLTDEQLKAIAEKGGVIGVAFVPEFLSVNQKDATIETVVSHIKHIVDVVGIDHVAFGSDFDGMSWPNYVEKLSDASSFGNIYAILEGIYFKEDLEKISYRNWLRVLENIVG